MNLQTLERETLVACIFDATSVTIVTQRCKYRIAGDALTEVSFSNSTIFNQRIVDISIDIYGSEDAGSDDMHAIGDFTIVTESGFIDFQLTAKPPINPLDYPFTITEL